MYLVGDQAVHPMHGAGRIEAITQERLAGRWMEYYVFRIAVGGLVLKIPTDSCEHIGMRAPCSLDEMDVVLHAIPELEVEMTVNWSHRYRENMERIKSGQPLEVARVIKGLMWREARRGLSNGERKMLHTAKQILISEVVLVRGVAYQEAERRIGEMMMTGVK